MPPESPPLESSKQQRMEEQYAELASLAGGLAHEIKNPLSTLNLNLQLLAEDFHNVESQRERRALQKIEKLQKIIERLEALLNDFLRFARVGGLRRDPTNVGDVVQEMIDFYSPQAEAHGIVTRDELKDDVPPVLLDRDLFKQALFNLLLNAQNAMPNGGELILRTRVVADKVYVDVIDTGVGMSDETLARIYKPFYSTRPGGSGLGLPTTKRIVEAHDGRLRVQSALGKGTAFTIELPAAPPRA